MSVTIQTPETKGTTTVSVNNVTYTPANGKTGTDTVVLRISDGNGGAKDVTVTVDGVDTMIYKVGNIVTDTNTGLQW